MSLFRLLECVCDVVAVVHVDLHHEETFRWVLRYKAFEGVGTTECRDYDVSSFQGYTGDREAEARWGPGDYRDGES